MSNTPAILVTGRAGYIGAHCCRTLTATGFRPVVYDNLSTGDRNFLTGPLVVGDLLDRQRLASCFAEHNFGAVMHFAAVIGRDCVGELRKGMFCVQAWHRHSLS
jgi:UDP-glucose 4-epimerase